MKRLILVTSPPASGKTYVSKKLAERLDHLVYLDKDTLIPLSKKIFEVAKEPYDRSSEFFEENIRDAEYEAIVALALEAIEYEDIVLINAPFSREIRDCNYINELKKKLSERGAVLSVVWVRTDIDVVKRRMIERGSDRDTSKLANWDEYIKTCDFSIPKNLDSPDIRDDLLIFENSSEEEFRRSMARVYAILEGKEEVLFLN